MMPLPLHVEGNLLVTSEGKSIKLPGVDAFDAFRRHLLLDGKGFDPYVLPVLREWKQIAIEGGYTGPIALRVFRHASGTNPFAIHDPWSYTKQQIWDFTLRCGEEGFYVDWTAGDYQLCFPSADPRMGEVDGMRGINQHHNEFCAALVGVPNAIWNVCNEAYDPHKNGLDTTKVKPPPWAPAVQYSGNYADGRDKSHDLNCINFHVPRDAENGVPKWVTKGFESAPYLWVYNKPIFYDEDMGFDEVETGSRSNNPEYARILGLEIAVVNAVYFHCSAGMRGDSLGPKTRLCAVQWFKGVTAGIGGV